MTAAAKNVMWNWGSEDLVVILDVVFVKMAYRKESRLSMNKTHYLEVTKYSMWYLPLSLTGSELLSSACLNLTLLFPSRSKTYTTLYYT